MIGRFALKRIIKNSLVEGEAIKWSFFDSTNDLIKCMVRDENRINSLVVEVEDTIVKLSCKHLRSIQKK